MPQPGYEEKLTMETTRERVVKILAEIASLDAAYSLKDEDEFGENLNMDSLDLVEAILDIESEFNLEIPDEDMDSVNTVGALVAYVEKRLAAA